MTTTYNKAADYNFSSWTAQFEAEVSEHNKEFRADSEQYKQWSATLTEKYTSQLEALFGADMCADEAQKVAEATLQEYIAEFDKQQKAKIDPYLKKTEQWVSAQYKLMDEKESVALKKAEQIQISLQKQFEPETEDFWASLSLFVEDDWIPIARKAIDDINSVTFKVRDRTNQIRSVLYFGDEEK